MALGNVDAIEGSMWTVFWIPNCSFSCLCFANSPWEKKKMALELVIQLEYIISNGCTAMTGFNGSVLGIRTIQTKVTSEKSMSHLVVKPCEFCHLQGLYIWAHECLSHCALQTAYCLWHGWSETSTDSDKQKAFSQMNKCCVCVLDSLCAVTLNALMSLTDINEVQV